MKPVDCPTCKQRVEPDAKTFPFCSERCRLVDLGNWLDEKYRVPNDDGGAADDSSGKEPSKH